MAGGKFSVRLVNLISKNNKDMNEIFTEQVRTDIVNVLADYYDKVRKKGDFTGVEVGWQRPSKGDLEPHDVVCYFVWDNNASLIQGTSSGGTTAVDPGNGNTSEVYVD